MKAQERLHRETGLPSSSQEFGGVTLRCGAAGTCLCRSTKAHGGLIPDLRVGRRSGERTPAGRRNAARVGRKPIAVLVLRAVVLEAPRNSTRGRTGRREAASGTPSNPHTSGGPPRSRTRNPSSDLVEPGEWATALRARCADDRTRCPVEHRRTVAPDRGPRIRGCIDHEGAQIAVGDACSARRPA